MVASAFITFGIGTFLIVVAALKEVRDDLKKINDLAKFEKNQTEALSCLGDFIEVHNRMTQLSDFSHKNWQLISKTSFDSKN